MVEGKVFGPHIYERLRYFQVLLAIVPRAMQSSTSKDSKQKSTPYSRNPMQRPISVGIVILLLKRRPVDQRQRWMKRGSVLVHKSVCNMLRRKSRKRRREQVRRRSPSMWIWRLEDASTVSLHSGTYPGQILWNHCPPPFVLPFFLT